MAEAWKRRVRRTWGNGNDRTDCRMRLKRAETAIFWTAAQEGVVSRSAQGLQFD